MAVESVQVRLRRKLEEAFGVEEASLLMDRPPGRWSDLVTNHTLDVELDALRAELRSEMGELRGEIATLRSDLRREMAELSASVDRRLRLQTLAMTSTLLVGIGVTATLTNL